jgi:hypothetical protein
MPLAVRRSLLSLSLAALFVPGCPKQEEPAPSTSTSATPEKPDDTPTPDSTPTPKPAAFDRLTPHTMAAIGPQPGLVAGGMIHGAFQFHRVLAWLRSVPLPGEVGRELAEMSQETGIDVRAEDFERRFAIPADAVISMTLLRPLDEGGTELRSELMRGGSVLDAIAIAGGEDRGARGLPSGAEKPIERSADGSTVEPPKGEPPKDGPPKLSESELEWGRKLLESASGLGLHSRVAIPVTDSKPILDYVRLRAGQAAQLRWAPVCASHRGAVCVGEGDLVAVIRGVDKVVVIDVVMFATRPPTITATQRKIIDDAVKLAADTADHGLRGDASLAFESTPLVKFAQLDALRRALSGLSWEDNPDESIRTRMAEVDAFAELASAPQLFHGARLDAVLDGDDLHAEARWLLVPGQADNSKQAFEVAPTVATVPALAGLCDGAIACFRTSGLPRPSTIADRLGIGAWSRGPDAAERSVGSLEDSLIIHAMIASWPNLLGSLARLPAIELGGGAEGAVATNVLDMVGRVQSVGGSLRSASIGRQAVVAQYVVYARTSATDAGIPRGIISLGGGTMRDTTLPGTGGNAAIFEVPEDDFPMTVVSRPDPPTDGTTPTGWVAMVDAPDRMSWLLGLAAEAYAGPAAYAEIPDVARAIQSWPELAVELESMRVWLERRSLRATFEIVDGEPVIRAALVRPN